MLGQRPRFSAFAVIFASFTFGRVSPLSLLPVVALAVLLAFGAVRRDPLLRLAALCAGALYVLVGLAVSLAKAF